MFRVVGDARVFEAQFRWEVRDANGAALAGGPARTAGCCEWARFFVDVDLTGAGAPAQPLSLVLWEPSAADGRPLGTVEIPLRLSP
jgi:hypothetical protein